MTELSKTARASMGKAEKKEVVVETQEEAIRQLRLNLDAGLWVTPDRIRALLTAYDKLVLENTVVSSKAGKLQSELDTIITGCDSETIVALDKIQMAEIPNHELDHTDFGHDITHPIAEGA